jgi:hypothetical protein
MVSAFQELISVQTSIERFGEVGRRGKAKNQANSELFLTALPTGSFGVELTQLESNDLFNSQDVVNAISSTMKLVKACTTSDEEFAESISNLPPRSMNNLKQFFKAISDEESIIKIESNNDFINIPTDKVLEGFRRVDAAEEKNEIITFKGQLRGVLLDSKRFEASDDEGNKYSGRVDSNISEEDMIGYDHNFLNEPCEITLEEQIISFGTGKVQKNYTLLKINSINQSRID